MKRSLCILISLLLLAGSLSACGDEALPSPSTGATEATEGTSAPPAEVDFSKTDADMFTDRDLEAGYDDTKAVTITLSGNSATASSDTVKIDGTRITITEEASYVISGTLDDGMLIVDTDDSAKLQLVFDNAHIHSSTSAALYILEADKVFLTLAQDSENTLSNGGTFTAIDENNIDGALFSKQDLTLNGQGSLCVTSPAGHGIVCKDDLVITGGAYTVESASHGLDANDSVRLANAALTITAGKDGIHAENSDDSNLGFVYVSSGSAAITAEGDGISAGAYGQFAGGSFTITAGGGSENGSKASSGNYGGFMGGGFGGGMGRPGQRPGSVESTTTTEDASTSMKGIKAEGSLLFSDGTFTIDSADDAIHANVSATVNGGTFTIASGDDAVHAEETLTVTNCSMDISESYEGLEALNIAVSGGNIRLVASDDGLNAAGGNDASGTTGGRDGMFGGGMGGRPGGMGGGMSSNSNGSIAISGGRLHVTASGDGIDANGTLEITGGYTVVEGPTQGDTATLDYDRSAVISGGTFIGTGASGMAQTFSDSSQGVFAVRVGSQAADSKITLTDKDGKVLIEHTPALGFQVVILSCPEMVSGESYTITVGTVSEAFEAN